MKKAAWIEITGVLAFCALLLTGCGWEKVEGEDLRYPCQWKESGKNKVILQIDAETAPEGYAWYAEDYDGSMISVGDPQVKEDGVTEFTIISSEVGMTYATFVCESTDEFAIRNYELEVAFQKTGEKSQLTVENVTWNQPETYRGGEETDFPYACTLTDEGELKIQLAGMGADFWQLEASDPEIVAVSDLVSNGTISECLVQGQASGQCTLTVFNKIAGYSVILELSVDEEGKLTVLSVKTSELSV